MCVLEPRVVDDLFYGVDVRAGLDEVGGLWVVVVL